VDEVRLLVLCADDVLEISKRLWRNEDVSKAAHMIRLLRLL
jgi:hypothetical protein